MIGVSVLPQSEMTATVSTANSSLLLSLPDPTSISSDNVNNNNNINDPDQEKQVRQWLPKTPDYYLQSLSHVDTGSWRCRLSVDLKSEAECLKWLGDLSDLTRTEWRLDQSLKGQPGLKWGAVYKCNQLSQLSQCNAKIEMKIVNNDDNNITIRTSADHEKNNNSEDHKCLVSLDYFHNHPMASNGMLEPSGFKVHDHFDSLFKSDPDIPTTSIDISMLQPLSQDQLQNQMQVILPPPQPQDQQQQQQQQQHHDTFSIDEVSERLNQAFVQMQELLKKSGTGCAAVKQFTDQFHRIKSDTNTLENALCNFGGVLPVTLTPLAPTVVTSQPPPQWSLTPIDPDLGQDLDPMGGSDETNDKKDRKGGKRKTPSTVLPGQIDPVTGKRRKRSRCGTCQGCINRDKTQDCRTCRNCMDQKRYGGPGRLKKACVKRSCIIMATPGDAPSKGAVTPVSTTPTVVEISALPITLPLHPVPVSSASMANSSGVDTTTTTAVPSAVLSWPNGPEFAPTFQVQQPVQFTYQTQIDPPPPYSEAIAAAAAAASTTAVVVSTSTNTTVAPSGPEGSSTPTLHLETIAAEAARHLGIN